jgi:hypothetical protein
MPNSHSGPQARGSTSRRSVGLRRTASLRAVVAVVMAMVAELGCWAAEGRVPAADPATGKAGIAETETVATPAVAEAAAADPTASLEGITVPSLASLLWDAGLSLRTWGGYKDNPLLSALNPLGSGLVGMGGELMVVRVPADGREVAFFAMVENVFYVEDQIQPETVAVIDGRFKRRWDDGWSAGVAAEYFYLRQVFDASDIVGLPVIVPARGQMVALRPMVGRDLGPGWRTELEFEGSRQWLEEPLDSFWDLGPKVSVVRMLGAGSEAALSYRYRSRRFDDRLPLDADGVALPGTLTFDQHEVEAPWRRTWGGGGRWRTVVRTGFLGSFDNGRGYYDYHRLQLAATVRYVRKNWEIRAEAKARWYLYPVQTAGTGDDTHRRRDDLNLSLRGEGMVRKGLRVFGEYAYESLDENLPASDYRVNMATAGVELVW